MLDLSRTKLPNANLPNAKLSQAKAMARTLRDGLSGRSISLSHSACLELVAHQFGFANRNVLAARLESSPPPLSPRCDKGQLAAAPTNLDFREA